MVTCPGLISIAKINAMTNKQLGEDRFICLFTSRSQLATEGSQGRASSGTRGREHGRTQLAGLLPYSLLCFLIQRTPA